MNYNALIFALSAWFLVYLMTMYILKKWKLSTDELAFWTNPLFSIYTVFIFIKTIVKDING